MEARTVAGTVGDSRQGTSERSEPLQGHRARNGDASRNGDGGDRRPPAARRGRPATVRTSPRRVRLPELALGLLLVAGGALGAVLWYTSVTAEETIVVAARDLPRGHVVTADDLRAATVAGADGVALLSGDDAQVLLGRVLLTDVAASTALTPAMVSDRLPLAADEGLLSLALSAGQAPAELAPLDQVRLVVAPRDLLGGAGEPILLDEWAEVWSVIPPSDYDPTTLVTLRGPLSLATAVADADQVRLVLVDDGS